MSNLSSLSSLNIGAAEGVGVILSGRLMGNLMIRSVLTSISLYSIIGSACIKVGIVW